MIIYRLLIVDDEEIIVNGLYEIFSSIKELELDIYKAYSGHEAIDWLNRTRFDIVLTDIKMPEIDGLQLLDEIIRNWPQCRVIFLTGHNEFDYVYKAIQHKNVSYILKTEDPEKVVNEVENTIKDIEKGIKIQDLIQQAKEQMNMVQDLFQKDYFIHLLHKDTSLEVSKSQFEQLSIPLYTKRPVILLLGHVDNIPPDLSYWNKMQYLNSIRFILNKNLNTHVRSINIMDDNYRFILFMQPKELFMENKENHSENYLGLYRKAVSFLKGTLEVIQAICRESLGTSISFVLGGEACSWDNVAQNYYTLSQLLSYRIGAGMEMLIVDNEINNNILNINILSEPSDSDADVNTMHMMLRHKNFDAFEQCLELGQREKYFSALSELMEPLKNIKGRNANLAVVAYYKIAVSLLSYINRKKLSDKLSYYVGKDKLMLFDAYESLEEAIAYIYQLSNEIFNLQSEEEKSRADNTIIYIQKFIDDHLSENLSLVRLAEQVYLNPSYLSRLYKQATGLNLSSYIDSVRIEKAKSLMNVENLKIYEVAESVGYETPASFTRFFRKITGQSPQEYLDSIKSFGKES